MPPTDMCHTIARRMGDALENGRTAEAIRMGQAYLDGMLNQVDSAEFYYLLSTAHQRSGNPLQAEGFRQRALRSSNYDPLIKGDFYREEALSLLGTGHPTDPLVEHLIKVSRECHQSDQNRLAALDTVEGMLYYAFGDYRQARTCLNRADYLWREMEALGLAYDELWRKQHRFERMRAESRLGNTRVARAIAGRVLQDPTEHDERRLTAARLIRRLPRLGVRWVDWMYH